MAGVKMIRTLWFALFCLVGVMLLAGVRAISTPPDQRAEIVDGLADHDLSEAAVKSDKQAYAEIGEPTAPAERVPIKTIKIILPKFEEATRNSAPEVVGKQIRTAYAHVRSRAHHGSYRRHKRDKQRA
jgi:hypothetical protein